MERKKKETNNKKKISKELNYKKQSTIFFVIIAIFVLLILIGILASKTLNTSFGVSTYNIQFWKAQGGEHIKTCKTDEYGFLDPDCAYEIGCTCRRWSFLKTTAGTCPSDLPAQQQTINLESASIYTTRFTKDETYYCFGCSSYLSTTPCEISKPQESCYVCTGGSGPVRTINATRAATMTGASDSSKCKPVSDEECNPKPSTEAPKNKCYSCKLGEGKEYEYATSPEEAANKTGGTSCVEVSNTNCDNPPKSCYACDTKDGKQYLNTTSKENAEKAITGATNCTIVNSSQCDEVPNNPKTGTAGIIIAWLVGLSALTYSFIYFVKLRKLSN